jgi:Lrp/AsnC family transcriptional regulator
MNPHIDTVDMKLLAELQRDASLSTPELAVRIGLSQSPCWRRLQRLRAEGYIQSTVAIVDRRKFGFPLQIFAQLKMSRLTDESRADLLRRIDATPEILECYTILGEMDLMMKVLVPDTTWYQQFLVSVLMKLPGVSEVHSVLTLSQMKSTTAIPLTTRKLKS